MRSHSTAGKNLPVVTIYWQLLEHCCPSMVTFLAPASLSKTKYSRTSRERPPKMLSLDVRLWEVVAYESLDYNGWKFISH